MLKYIQKTLFAREEREHLKSLVCPEYIRLFKEQPENLDFLMINCNLISSKMIYLYHSRFDTLTIACVNKDNTKQKMLDCCLNFFDRTFSSNDYYTLFMSENFILNHLYSIQFNHIDSYPLFYHKVWDTDRCKEQILLIIRKNTLNKIYSTCFGELSFFIKNSFKLHIKVNDYYEERIVELDDNLSKYYFDKLMKEENKNV